MSFTASFSFSATTGQTLKAALVSANVVDADFRDITDTFYDSGKGVYEFVSDEFPDGVRGTLYFYTGDIGAEDDWTATTVAVKNLASVNPEEFENVDAKISSVGGSEALEDIADRLTAIEAKTDLITTDGFDLVSPVAENGTLTLFRGDDYFSADGRAITFTSTAFPNLTGATVRLKLSDGSTVYVATASNTTSATFELSRTTAGAATGTANLDSPQYTYEVEATLATSGHVCTIATGSVVMKGQI